MEHSNHPKVNARVRREFKLAYYNSAVHFFNHYTKRTPLFQLATKRQLEIFFKLYYRYICSGWYLYIYVLMIIHQALLEINMVPLIDSQFELFWTHCLWTFYFILYYIYIYKIQVGNCSRGWPKGFTIATTPRCRRGRYSIPWIAPLYPWSVSYNAEY